MLDCGCGERLHIRTAGMVIWRSWKISLRIEFKGAAPGENKMTHDDYLPDARLQQQVGVVFGHQILQYTQALCQGNFDYLECLPNDLLLQILHGNEGRSTDGTDHKEVPQEWDIPALQLSRVLGTDCEGSL
ncbi:F-box only protein 36-like isoform X2 [Coregonus clupeaformis]|uniref:F-box only protein 36-like isoform X2 n=1 Tax=Coregonus clupeaformis TaxID=59861 RepID=UPI001BE0760A|nr:F-box only protein 36-like isoform X2 [Coregonus clupeaformis]